MSWFRMMGRDSIEYHRATVLGRDDDHAGSALAYYGSRGETPLEWGGRLAERLGLSGAVTDETYDAMFARGGAVDPVLGTKLVDTERPGVELVVAAHKSVAILGVIGRADDMHAILDAETDATLAYLEAWFERQGGRRGRAQSRTRTSGLLWARTRHATTRAGDPSPHDHVLIVNVSEMLDSIGGWKALDTAALRDVNHAATMAGRMAAADEAVRRGYPIEPDHGPSGKLDHWRISGIPKAACDAMSKRSAEIELHLESAGFTGYRARGIAARETRAHKTDESPDQLLPRWHEELAEAGWPTRKITQRLVAVNERHSAPTPLTDAEIQALAADLLSAEGELGNRKAFTRRDVVRVIAPMLYGQPFDALGRAVRAVTEHHESIPLVGQPAARERAWAAASVLAVEQSVAEVSRRLAARDGAVVSPAVITNALTASERAVGRPLTAAQSAAVTQICGGGRSLDLIIGIAGSGKTTALTAVRAAYEAEGYRVLGAATSGQAARALGDGADVDSRTVASLLWRLRTGSLALDTRSIVLLDEAGMTDDRSMLAVLKAAQIAGTTVVVIGDHRQLSAVGLGGGLEALVGRHAEAVHALDDNVRQHDPAERAALDHLRDGVVREAVEWYRTADRLVPATTRDDALDAAVDRWFSDEAGGKSTLLLAWRRADVAELNRRARQRYADAGMLGAAEIIAPGGLRYSVGDRVVALAPSEDRALNTSERGTVTAIGDETLVVRSDAGRSVRLTREQFDAQRLGHAYAMTVHRVQGATVDRAHVYADGGGRELAYVAMSRARESTHVHLVADDLDQGLDDLRREWSTERRDRWTIDTDSPAQTGDRRRPDLAARVSTTLRGARLRAERAAVLATLPPDRSAEIMAAHAAVGRLREQLEDIRRARGPIDGSPLSTGRLDLWHADADVKHVEERLRSTTLGRRERRRLTRQRGDAIAHADAARERYDELVAPERDELTASLDSATNDLTALTRADSDRRLRAKLAGVERRVASLDRKLGVDHGVEIEERGFGVDL